MINEITEAEWIAELQKHMKAGDDDLGFTTEEWSQKLNIDNRYARNLIRRLVKGNKMALGSRYVTNDWDGRNRIYKVYRLL